MYNGYAVNAGKLCPTGWHIPSYDEWNTLKTFIGGGAGGKKLKETGTIHWRDDPEGTNESWFYSYSQWLAFKFGQFFQNWELRRLVDYYRI